VASSRAGGEKPSHRHDNFAAADLRHLIQLVCTTGANNARGSPEVPRVAVHCASSCQKIINSSLSVRSGLSV
jgi:hypothetical protein